MTLHSLEARTMRALADAAMAPFAEGTARFKHKASGAYVHVPVAPTESSRTTRQQAFNGLMGYLKAQGCYVDEQIHEDEFDLCAVNHKFNPALGPHY